MKHSMIALSALAAATVSMPAAAQKAPPATAQVAAARYFMPKTVLTATATLKLTSCTKPDANVELTIAARGEPDLRKAYSFDPRGLASWRQSRDFSVTVLANGTLSAISSTSEDKTGAIIGNILKAVVSIAGAAAVDGATAVKCNEATLYAMQRADVIRKQLRDLRSVDWTAGKPLPKIDENDGTAQKLVAELAAIESGPLTLVLTTEIELPASAVPIEITWNQGPLKKWFDGADVPPTLEELTLSFDVAAAEPIKVDSRKCTRYIEVPQPAMVGVNVVRGAVSARALSVGVQQWGSVGRLCLDAPVFASRTVSATFDGFGTMTKLDWKSNARGEGASALFGTAAEQAALFAGKVKPDTALETTKSEADLIEQQIRLEKARRCLETMQAVVTCAS